MKDVLKLAWSAEEAGRNGVRLKDVSKHADVVPSTATENIQRLTRQDPVTYERYGRVQLTPQERAIALDIVHRHHLLKTYPHGALDFSWDEVHEEAKILRHAVSDRLLDRFDRVPDHPSHDPHGDPVPRAGGSSDNVSDSPLDALDITIGGITVRPPDRDPETLRTWREADFVPGAYTATVASDAGGVTVLLKDGQILLLDSAQTSGIVTRDWAIPTHPRLLLTRPRNSPARLTESAGRAGNARRRTHRRGVQSSGEDR